MEPGYGAWPLPTAVIQTKVRHMCELCKPALPSQHQLGTMIVLPRFVGLLPNASSEVKLQNTAIATPGDEPIRQQRLLGS